MHILKFSGVLEEIKEQYPNIDISQFLQEKLGLPDFKALELASRIEKTYFQKATNKTEQNVRTILRKTDKTEILKTRGYPVDCLSEKEFEFFIKWLLEELGYEVNPEKHSTNLGFDLVDTKDGELTAIQARRYPKTYKVLDSIVLIAQEAKRIYGCQKSIVLITTYFTQQAMVEAQRLGVELWDKDTLANKIEDIRKKANLREQPRFPHYKGSLLQSLLNFEEIGNFIIEPRAGGKFDLYLSSIKFPLLTFQAQGNEVIRCVYRIKDNKPVGEHEGITLIGNDRDNKRTGPNEIQAYELIIQYLEEILA
jgi:hypothetical protein